MIEKIVSGGQTGVDRAALDAAMDAGIACGGWCPRGRRAEDGAIPDHYSLREAPAASYIARTRLNVRDSDGTLALAHGPPAGGTRATVAYAARIGRPCLVIDMGATDSGATIPRIEEWLETHRIRVLNVAGPRESGWAGAYGHARDLVWRMLAGPTE